ncbi:MAG TPA: hypothetical protein DCX41_08330 [Aequorivita sp.]|jgi:hypothetical protein|nr:hypothetical protein [Aequorivita sp.]|tara:strand:+ start:387 stop:1697 length:1311 start_codon:yes stop_codon:yes gene_type:complete
MDRKIIYLSEKYFEYLLGIIFIGTTLYIATKGAILHNDSDGYLNMSIIRLPVYSLFVQLFYFKKFEILLIVSQMSFICASIYILVKNLKENLGIQAFWCLLLSIVLLYPSIFGIKIGNSVLSEAIAYPLYLLLFHFLSLAIFTENQKYIGKSLLILFALLLTRGQFLYFVPIVILLLIWICVRKRDYKKGIPLLLVSCILPFAVSITDHIYHKVANGYFEATPWTGLHLLTPAMYVANATDVEIYKTEKERYFFEKIQKKLWERNLSIYQREADGIDATEFYRTNYTRIANWTIYDYGKELLPPSLTPEEKFIELEKITTKLAGPLIIKNFGAWSKLSFKNFVEGFKSNLLVLFYFIILGYSGTALLKRKVTNTSKVLFLGALLTISNTATVAVGMHTIERFTFYNDWFFFLAIFLMLFNLKKLEGNKPRMESQLT